MIKVAQLRISIPYLGDKREGISLNPRIQEVFRTYQVSS